MWSICFFAFTVSYTSFKDFLCTQLQKTYHYHLRVVDNSEESIIDWCTINIALLFQSQRQLWPRILDETWKLQVRYGFNSRCC